VSKYALTFFLLLITAAAFCQKKSKVNLISSTKSEGVKRNGIDVIKVYNGVWRQDFSIMRSDSAYFHQAQNSFEAFGNVHITQGDTLNIYSDKLNYDGNTKIAILIDNVIMVDKDATLTTNYFTYNTATRIGTYTDGGKLVNKGNTLTSKNGYYLASSRDAYFRYNVVCTTTDALILTDTMRYNSKTRINYFYGPTHIYGTKDKDTLDTDYGTYDTNLEQAFFTKKNMYRQGTKSLKGDTLFYDRAKGFGRAVKHVTFSDREQKITIKGGLGTYFKKNDLTIVTRDPYVILVTEDKDTTKKAKTGAAITQTKGDSISSAKFNKKTTAANKKLVMPNLNTLPAKLTPAQLKKADSLTRMLKMPVIDSLQGRVKGNRDTAIKLLTQQRKKIDKSTQKQIRDAAKGIKLPRPDTNELLSPVAPILPKDTGNVKRDSVYMSADTIETRILTFKELNVLQEADRVAHIVDTSKIPKKPPLVYKKAPKVLTLEAPKFAKDTSYYHRDYFGKPKPVIVKVKKDLNAGKPKKYVKPDSTFLNRRIVLSDTSRIRILMAFHGAKVFKSDLQAKADSMFYSNSDSTIRCYNKPMIWTQGAQLSGDTINLQMRNKKMDNLHMFPSAFIVYLENADSTHFNQIGGKQMRGFFKDDKLNRVFVEGNVESIYFVRDSTTKQITDMQRSFSSRMWVRLKNNEVTDVGFVTKPDHRYIPMTVVKEEEKILKGFLWKPKDRPVSKESVLPSYNKKLDTTRAKLPAAGAASSKKMLNGRAGAKLTDTTQVKAGQDSILKTPVSKTAGDTTKNSSVKGPPLKVPVLTVKKDSVGVKAPLLIMPAAGTKADSSAIKKAHPIIPAPAINAKKDTTVNKQ